VLAADYDGTLAHHGRIDDATWVAASVARVGPEGNHGHRPAAESSRITIVKLAVMVIITISEGA